jgi:hypothetical protein
VNYKIKIMTNENPNPAEEDEDGYEVGRDEQHLPHETWHVVQEKKGRIRPRVEQDEENDEDVEGAGHPPVPPIQ